MAEWIEIADGVLQARYEPLDVSICLVRGDDRLLLVDTRSNPREARELVDDVAGLGIGEIRRFVNTHAHYDHSFGNQVFAELPGFGHRGIPAHFAEFETPRLEAWNADPEAQPQYDWREVRPTPPGTLIDAPTELELGGRRVRLLPLGPGHTDTDLVVHVPDADVWIVGDVVEESGPPMYGSGSFPLDWPAVLFALAEQIDDDAIVVPGHGRPVDRAFVVEQAAALDAVAQAIRVGHARTEPIEYVIERGAGASGIPEGMVEVAVLRGYAQLNG